MGTSHLLKHDRTTRITKLSLVLIIGLLLAGAWLLAPRLAPVRANEIGVGLVTDGPVSDDWLNLISYQGLLKAEIELGVVGNVYTATNGEDTELKLAQCAVEENNLCISAVFGSNEAISNTAATYPSTQFALVDSAFDEYPDNLRGMTFAVDEVGYLAGTLAGLMSESGIIGGIGGLNIPPVSNFLNPYDHAATCINPEMTTIISYTNNFINPELGAETAQEMITQGADVIFGVAGPTGNGAVLTATQSSVWAIGVDVDQFVTLFDNGNVAGSEYLLSSAMKHFDQAVFSTISDVVSGTFTSGTVVYGLAENGVGLAPFHDSAPSVSQEVRMKLAQVRNGLIGGFIMVDGPCPTNEIQSVYLPMATK